jgi:hypothetical protein
MVLTIQALGIGRVRTESGRSQERFSLDSAEW